MSLNSIDARASVVGLNGPYLSGAYPEASLDVDWRQRTGWGYAGLRLITGPDSPGAPGEQTYRLRDRPFRRQSNRTLGGFNEIND